MANGVILIDLSLGFFEEFNYGPLFLTNWNTVELPDSQCHRQL
jgi:hypothetical protein